jgi:hypothetical protein
MPEKKGSRETSAKAGTAQINSRMKVSKIAFNVVVVF